MQLAPGRPRRSPPLLQRRPSAARCAASGWSARRSPRPSPSTPWSTRPRRAGLQRALRAGARPRRRVLPRRRSRPRSELLRGPARGVRSARPRVLARARARGLQVHAWINVLLVGGLRRTAAPGHVAAAHPEWLMVPHAAAPAALGRRRAGWPRLIEAPRDPATPRASTSRPRRPGVAAHLEPVVRELRAAPTPWTACTSTSSATRRRDYDYSRAALEGFRAPSAAGGWLLGRARRGPGRPGTRYRARPRSTRWPPGWRRAARASAAGRRRLGGGGAGRGDRPCATSARTGPDGWRARPPRRRLPDGLHAGHRGSSARQVEQARARVGPRAPVWAGIGAYRLPHGRAWSRRCRAARAAGASGVVLFSHESLAAARPRPPARRGLRPRGRRPAPARALARERARVEAARRARSSWPRRAGRWLAARRRAAGPSPRPRPRRARARTPRPRRPVGARRRWRALTLAEKVGADDRRARLRALPQPAGRGATRRCVDQVRRLKVGCVVVFESEVGVAAARC